MCAHGWAPPPHGSCLHMTQTTPLGAPYSAPITGPIEFVDARISMARTLTGLAVLAVIAVGTSAVELSEEQHEKLPDFGNPQVQPVPCRGLRVVRSAHATLRALLWVQVARRLRCSACRGSAVEYHTALSGKLRSGQLHRAAWARTTRRHPRALRLFVKTSPPPQSSGRSARMPKSSLNPKP